jgi:hypothetical protein
LKEQFVNLLEVIHQRWAAAAALDSLLPAARVYTGMSADPSRPFAVIFKQSHRPLAQCNDGTAFAAIGLRIQVFHDDHDAAAAIIDQLKTTFDRTQFSLSGSDTVTLVQCSNDWEQQDNDGVWQMTVDFTCTVCVTLNGD